MPREVVTLKSTDSKKVSGPLIGGGRRGRVYRYKSSDGKSYAVKKSNYSSEREEIMKEKDAHFDLYGKLPPNMKKHFPKPVEVNFNEGNKPNPKLYAMEEVPNTISLKDAMEHRHQRRSNTLLISGSLS